MEEPAVVVIESCRVFELRVDELEDLEADTVTGRQPRRLDFVQAFWVDLENGPSRRFSALGRPYVAQFAEAEDAGVPFDGGFAVGDRDGDVVYDVVEFSGLQVL